MPGGREIRVHRDGKRGRTCPGSVERDPSLGAKASPHRSRLVEAEILQLDGLCHRLCEFSSLGPPPAAPGIGFRV